MNKALVLGAALAVAVAVTVGGAGCNLSNEDLEFLYALPSREILQARAPGEGAGMGTSEGALGQRRDALSVGDASEGYKLTVGAAGEFNKLVFGVLDIVEKVRRLRPTERTLDRRVWGPFDDEHDKDKQARLIIERAFEADGTPSYTWGVEFRRKSGTGDWLAGVEGFFAATKDVRKGTGSFSFEAERLRDAGLQGPDDDPNVQKLEFDYATDEEPVEIGVRLVTAESVGHSAAAYAQDGSGAVRTLITANVGGTPAQEQLYIDSRWVAGGAGRADMEITGGDLGPSRVTAIECWDAQGKVVYARPWEFFKPDVGTVNDCAVPPATP